ncbi:MAG: MgtC/SapB family protein [Rhodothermales bacterium]|nr:MgtC/SapB family protein [Rhodothermales bacterium]
MDPDPTHTALFYRFGAALAIGLLVGLQREYAYRHEPKDDEDEELFAGARTFSLLALLGCGAAFIADLAASPWVFVAILVLAGGLITAAYVVEAREGSAGLTTEVAALLTVLAGALCFWDALGIAAALGVAVTVLLALKLQTRSLVRNLDREDVYATLKFAVITLIILPVLPREPIVETEPFEVLVPYKIWLMVVFISGISFLGYILIQLVGARRGVGLTGVLGGLASSTAVTLTFAQRSRDTEGMARSFGLAILLAWSVMFVRVMVEVAAVNPPLLSRVWLPMTAATVVSLAYCAYLYLRREQDSGAETGEFTNPFELGPALTFGALYAVILLAANAARLYFGDAGVYASSIASGLADVDAITLSMAELSRNDGLDPATATRAIVLAAASNTVVKGGIVLTTGSKALRKVLLPGLIATLATAIGVVFLVG